MQKFLTRPVVHNDGIMRNCTDGDYYRKDDFFSSYYGKNIQILSDILHYSRDTARVQIKLSSIFLLACVKTKHVKKYGLRLILVDFIIGIKE